jgi:stalled ribosome rescue protein Dom34
MPLHQGVVLIDHQNARVLRLDPGAAPGGALHAHKHNTRQHGSTVRTEHEFFGEVCDALAEFKEILVAGNHLAQADFRHYLEKHRPQVSPRVIGWETVDHPSEGQLLALARKFYDKHNRMTGQGGQL